MSKKTKDMITINDVEYDVAEMNDSQKYTVNQVRALNNKIVNAQFEIDQLRAAYDMFSRVLVDSVNQEQDDESKE
jgi:alpha-N-acetylglucosamine transferase